MFSFMRRGRGFYREVALLALPLVIQNLITNAMGLLDTVMVGTLGELPLAAVALANIPCFVATFVIFGIQSGCSVLISQNWGKGDLDAINRVLGMGLYAAGSATLVFALVTLLLPLPFMSLFGSDGQVVALAARYIRIIGLSHLADSFVQIYIAAHRSMENPRLGLYILGVTVVSNTFLNWVLIFGKFGVPALGVTGAALATLISRCLGLALALTHFCGWFRPSLSALLCPGKAMAGQFFRCAAPVVFNETAWGLGTALYATVMLTAIFATQTLRGFNTTNVVGVLRGGGDVKAATFIDTFPLWCIALPLAALAGLVLRLDILWVYLAIVTEGLVKLALGLRRFRSGAWINDLTREKR